MDLPAFLLGMLPVVVIGFVSVVAFRRRKRDRSSGSFPLIVNRYTVVIEPNADARGSLPVVQPAPTTTTSQKL